MTNTDDEYSARFLFFSRLTSGNRNRNPHPLRTDHHRHFLKQAVLQIMGAGEANFI